MRLFLAVVAQPDRFISLPWTEENYLLALKTLNEVPSQMSITVNGNVVAMIYDSLTPGKILVESLAVSIEKFHELAFERITLAVLAC